MRTKGPGEGFKRLGIFFHLIACWGWKWLFCMDLHEIKLVPGALGGFRNNNTSAVLEAYGRDLKFELWQQN